MRIPPELSILYVVQAPPEIFLKNKSNLPFAQSPFLLTNKNN